MSCTDLDTRRFVLVGLLTVALLGQFVHYGGQEQRCPNVECYATDYGAYVGEQVELGGPVVGTDPTAIAVSHGSGESLELVLTGTEATPERGTLVSVYGILRSDHRLEVIEIVVKPPTDRWYMFAVSGLAVLLVGALGLRYWRISVQTLTVRKRGER